MGRNLFTRQKLGFLYSPVSSLQPCGRRKRTVKQICDESRVKRHKTVVDTLPEELLISILSFLPLKEAAKTSVLSRKWRYLWQFTNGNLEFDDKDYTERPRKFIKWVNHVLKLHRGSEFDQVMFRFKYFTKDLSHVVDSWIDHTMQKNVKGFQLKIPNYYHLKYNFPDLKTLSSSGIPPAFLSLKSLRLVYVNVNEVAVHYFLSSCPYLEELRVNGSDHVKNLKVVDPLPHFKVLEIYKCPEIQSLEISVKTLVSFTYVGKVIELPMDNVPNLKELTLGGKYCKSFIFQSNRHLIYPVQVEKLVLKLPPNIRRHHLSLTGPPDFPQFLSLKQLELEIVTYDKHDLLFVLLLIKAAPLLERFRLKIQVQFRPKVVRFPKVSLSEATGFVHDHLKVVELSGYICPRVQDLILHLHKVAPSFEMLVMHLEDMYHGDERKFEEWAKSHILSSIKFFKKYKLPPCFIQKKSMDNQEVVANLSTVTQEWTRSV